MTTDRRDLQLTVPFEDRSVSTSSDSSAANQPAPEWRPRPFYRRDSATVLEDVSEEEQWAELASQARESWWEENPF